jgi:hypothetical protein
MPVEIIQHAHVIPWSVDAAFFIHMLVQGVRAVGLLALVAPVYAVLYRQLSNRCWTQAAEDGVGHAGVPQFSQ